MMGSPVSNRHPHFFITGPAGSGKSFVLDDIEKWLRSRHISYLKMAPTGIAANNVNGRTIHSSLSIGARGSDAYYTSIFNSPGKIEELKLIKVLIIDEVSMVSSELFEFVSDTFARLHENMKSFGGLCVLLFGDLMQLPPVDGSKIFKSSLWKNFYPLFLRQSRRQADDPIFFDVLNKIRFGKIDESVWNFLVEKAQAYSARDCTYLSTFLVSRKIAARKINDLLISTLPNSENNEHVAIDRENSRILTDVYQRRFFKYYTNYPEVINIAIGSRVMFLENSLSDIRISNGTQGVIIDHLDNGIPRVAFPVPEGIQVRKRKLQFIYNWY
jgi:ATP-dependent exoDNAse (exonuclease V) alpha subunit